MGRVEWRCTLHCVNDHAVAIASIGTFSDVPKFGVDVVSGGDQMLTSWDKLGITDNIEPLGEVVNTTLGVGSAHVELDGGSMLEVGSLTEVANADVAFVGRVEEHGALAAEGG